MDENQNVGMRMQTPASLSEQARSFANFARTAREVKNQESQDKINSSMQKMYTYWLEHGTADDCNQNVRMNLVANALNTIYYNGSRATEIEQEGPRKIINDYLGPNEWNDYFRKTIDFIKDDSNIDCDAEPYYESMGWNLKQQEKAIETPTVEEVEPVKYDVFWDQLESDLLEWAEAWAYALGGSAVLETINWPLEALSKNRWKNSLNRAWQDRRQNISYEWAKTEKSLWEKRLKEREDLLKSLKKSKDSTKIAKAQELVDEAKREIKSFWKVIKPTESRETLIKYNIAWSPEQIAGWAWGTKKFLWKSTFEPMAKEIDETTNLAEWRDNLRPESFSAEREARQQFSEIIEEMKKLYANDTKVWLEELRKIHNDIKYTNNRVNWKFEPEKLADVKNDFKTYLEDRTKELLKKYFPERATEIDELFWDYSKLTAAEEAAVKWVSLNEKNPGLLETLTKKWINKLLKKSKFKTKTGQLWTNIFHALRPSTWLKWIANWLVKNPSEVEKLMSKTTSALWESLSAANPKNLNSFNPMDLFVMYSMEELWLEPGMYPITEIASYMLETSKLNKEGRDLPLYDSENSYVNQNKNAKKSESVSNIEEQPWYQQLIEYENRAWDEYLDLSEAEIEEILDSMK